MKTCFLFGHRDVSNELSPHIETAVEYHYTKLGIWQFIVGGYGNFDRIAGSAVKAVKLRHLDIDLRLLLPYHPAERPI